MGTKLMLMELNAFSGVPERDWRKKSGRTNYRREPPFNEAILGRSVTQTECVVTLIGIAVN